MIAIMLDFLVCEVLTKADIKYFRKLLGDDNIKTDQAHLIAYSYDATKKRFEPECVLFPRDEKDVQNILRYCNDKHIVIVPRGAGSGFTGGSLPSSGGVLISFEKHMNKLLEIDQNNMLAIVQPGLINMHLQKAVEEVGLFYPPDPASQEYCTIGGNVAENAGGMRAAKYGITKDYVMAVEAVLPSGQLIRAGKKTIKDVAGYNITGLLVGSEGTLAVITKIVLKLIPKPKMKKTYMGVFADVSSAMNAVFKSLSSGASPVAMEFLDSLVINALRQKGHKSILDEKAGAVLIGDVDGENTAQLEDQLAILKSSFELNGSIDFVVAKDDKQAQSLWQARRDASPSVTMYGELKLNEDISVPRSCLPQALDGIYKIGDKYGFKVPCFGHSGDGNIHVNLMVPDKDDETQVSNGHKAIEEIFQLVVDMEGSLSGEHGIGLSKAPYMHIAFDKHEMELFRAVKKAFDPNNILNPDKMGL